MHHMDIPRCIIISLKEQQSFFVINCLHCENQQTIHEIACAWTVFSQIKWLNSSYNHNQFKDKKDFFPGVALPFLR